MFFRIKPSGARSYVQIVENRWEQGRSRQSVLVTLGRVDELRASGQLDALLESGGRLSESLLVLSAHRRGEVPTVGRRLFGPVAIFERLWRETGCQAAVQSVGRDRGYGFSVERAVFLTVLHRLMVSGSDRSAMKWQVDYGIDGSGELQLHQLYRAMALLGEEIWDQKAATPFSPRCQKDLVEERLFHRRRDLFSSLDLVFFDTTSIYFEGEGGETLGQLGHSKDHRPDRKQMIVGAVVDAEGHPICCEMWPGNTTDVKTLIPVVDRMQKRFGIGRACVVADQGMMSREAVAALEERSVEFILGARMRVQKEISEAVVSAPGRFTKVTSNRQGKSHPSPLKVKDVRVEDRRYVVCVNEDEVNKDALDREAMVDSLRKKLRQGAKSLVGNRGYRRYVKAESGAFEIDEAKIAREARYDGTWVLRTNMSLPAAEVALRYKQLWVVEQMFRSIKSLLSTRPIFHRSDAAIRGHVFCSFLALILRKELMDKLEAAGVDAQWEDVLRDLHSVELIDVQKGNQLFQLRTTAQGQSGKIFQAVGVALPPVVRNLSNTAN